MWAIVDPRLAEGLSIGLITSLYFGGLATDAQARAARYGAPIPGLYAAGEITGHFHGTAPNAVLGPRECVQWGLEDCSGTVARLGSRDS